MNRRTSGPGKDSMVFLAVTFLLVFTDVFLERTCGALANGEASFYGESYIFTPFQDDSSSTTISFEFRTHRPQGLLLLAAGQTDYVVIQLNGGIVETRVNLGSGEAVTFSARGVRLDDSRWHSVVVNHSLDTVFLAVDDADQGQATSPGTYHDLNIDLGVLLGGNGNLKKDFYRDAKSFRGCLKNVLFNQHRVLEEAKELKSAQNAFQVAWHCDDEFSAPSDSPFSLSSDTSFIAFPHLRIYPETSGVFSCELKTRSTNAVILFNSGKGSTHDDFISVELVGGKPKLSIDKGSGVIVVMLDYEISDGKWHTLEVRVSEAVAELRIDSKRNMTRFHLGIQNNLNLANHLFVGGVGFKDRSHAVSLGLESLQGGSNMKGSMQGCVRKVVMNSRSYGFQQVQVSRLIDPGCAWEFPCALEPCVADAQCTELEGTDFRCDCEEQECVKEEHRSEFDDDHNNVANGVMSISEIEVVKGETAIINTYSVKVNSDFFNGGLQNEQVIFTVKERPKEGILEIKHRGENQDTFTLKDLMGNNVFYKHLGGQANIDSVTLEVAFNFADRRQESKLKQKYEFLLPIRIVRPRKEDLEVVLKHGSVISLTSNARMRITPEIVDVKKVDSVPSKLIFVVNYLRQSHSIFERSNEKGKSVTSFSLKEVQDGNIWFQHSEDKIVYTKINVTDGISVSKAADLRFKQVDLTIRVVNTTGISLSYGSNCLITSQNLSTSTNVMLEDLELLYRLTKPPEYGVIQRQEYKSSQWVDVETFTQRDIDSGRLRYLHLPESVISSYDSFKFEVAGKGIKVESQTFDIRFKAVILTVEHNMNMVLHATRFGKFSNQSLLVVSNSEMLDFKDIVYMVLRTPQKGNLYLIKRDVTSEIVFNQYTPLKLDDTFTQENINDGFVYFKFHNTGFEEIEDYADLQASFFGFTVIVRTAVQYSPNSVVSPVHLINNGLHSVPEGGRAVISNHELSIEMDKFQKFTFSIVRLPKHGSIDIIDSNSASVLLKNVSLFTMTDITNGQVVYKHDDSENEEDYFTFSATPQFDDSQEDLPEEIQEYSGTFQISMKMKNDNPPVRTVNKVFRIASGQTKALSTVDLAFADPDIDFDDTHLQYHTQSIANGDILFSHSKEVIYNFTQGDLQSGKLEFHHRGDSYARTPIVVSDGQFLTSALFEIQASPPFVNLENNTGIEVMQGKQAVISAQNLSIVTNMDLIPDEVTFQLIEKPKFGDLRVNGRQVMTFSFQELLENKVRYWHGGSSETEDQFMFAVLLNQIKTESVFTISILTEGMNDPPEIIHNQILMVLALHSKEISEDVLQVSHKDYEPREIEFIVTQLPEHGHLTVRGTPVRPGEAPEFTQEDISQNRVEYTSDVANQMSDKMIFDVGTDVQSLRHLEFLIEIIPQVVPQNEANVTLLEGGTISLSIHTLALKGKLAQNRQTMLLLEHPPVHGNIVLKNGNTNSHAQTFTYDDMVKGRVSYVHDGSESLSDEFVMKAEVSDGSAVSQMSHVLITVQPVDDQPPHVIVNTGLDLWTGSIALLTNENLQASDPDSDSSKVEFVVSAPTNGHLAYLNNTFKPISRFSQWDLDSGQVVFVHRGDENGEVKFQATDGTNNDEFRILRIRARRVQIFVAVNKIIKAFPNTPQPISNTSILASTSAENFSHPIVFTLVEPRPRKGRLVTLVGAQILSISSFTQQELNEGNVFFEHTGSMRSWSESEQLHFEITTTYSQTLVNQIFNVEISFSNINEGNFHNLLGIKVPSVEEGHQVVISQTYFQSDNLLQKLQSFRQGIRVEFSFISTARHGYLWFHDVDAEVGDIFTQEDLNTGKLVYKHDHSDTVEDKFIFAVKVLVPRVPTETSLSSAHSFNFTIKVQPVNDQGFELITRHPKIKLTQGTEIPITPHNLTTVDLDTGPEGIEYIILTQPDNGMLVLSSHPHVRLTSFTQKDINDDMIIFKHDGTRKASSSLYFKVWDKEFEPHFANLDIEVIPLKIQVLSGSHIPMVQGSQSVTLSNDHLRVSTNGDRKALNYMLLQPPQFGKLLKQNIVAKHFTQADIDGGALVYTQDNHSPGDDFFVCNIELRNIDCHLDAVQFDILMKPLVKQGPLLSSPGSHVAITRSSLDASQLAQLTNDNPKFSITSQPKHGQIMKKNRRRKRGTSETSFVPVSDFTFEDVIFTKIYYVAHSGQADNDSFTYSLSAEGVPPATGMFEIQLEPSEDGSKTEPAIGGRENSSVGGSQPEGGTSKGSKVTTEDKDKGGNSDKDTEGVKGTAVQSVDEDNNVVVIVTVLCILIVLGVIVVVVVLFLRWRRKNRSSSIREEKPTKPRPYISGPLQLEQPHVLIEPKNDLSPSQLSGEDAALVAGCDENTYVNTSLIISQHEEPTSSSPPGSPDVTQVNNWSSQFDSQSDQASEDMDRRSTMTSGRTSSASTDLMDWTLMDPDLLQHCRTTTPVLRSNQYWL